MLKTRTLIDLTGIHPRKPRVEPQSARVGIVCDLLEENWESMDLIGNMIVSHLRRGTAPVFETEGIRPSMVGRFTALLGTNPRFALNADRFLNRFWDYPRYLRRYREAYDVFHLIDHSYAQLALELPPGRTVVTCHDTETFRCLLEPEAKRSMLFRAMVGRTLRGLRRAALVVCPSMATRDALLAHNLVSEERLRVVPNGVHPSCSFEPDPFADREADRLLGARDVSEVDLLHVGTTVPRKRIDVLIRVFAEVKKRFSGARLIHAGGPLTPAQEATVDELRLRGSILILPRLGRRVLAAVYRRATAVLLPSEREGFGFPVVEAMACGTPVIASDIAALREAGGCSAVYCDPTRVADWVETISDLLLERRFQPGRWRIRCNDAVSQASRFTYAQFTNRMAAIYREILAGSAAVPGEVF